MIHCVVSYEDGILKSSSDTPHKMNVNEPQNSTSRTTARPEPVREQQHFAILSFCTVPFYSPSLNFRTLSLKTLPEVASVST